MLIELAVLILATTPPLSGIIILVHGHAYPPRIRTTLAMGATVLLMACTLAMLGVGSAILDGRQPFFPYLAVTGLPVIAVARAMHILLQPDFDLG